jgi:hypothetical protein
MARREIIDVDSEIMNVDEKVGKAKINSWGDVMIVQALLKYVREGKGGEPGFDFLPGSPPLRNPDGIFYSGETDRVILAFQKFNNRGFGRKKFTEDGVISHAKGRSTFGTGKKWTIVELSQQAEILCLARRHADNHITAILSAFPQVRIALNEFTLFF